MKKRKMIFIISAILILIIIAFVTVDIINTNELTNSKKAAINELNKIGSGTMHLPMIPSEPVILDFNHKLYISNTIFGGRAESENAELIGYFRNDIPVCSVKGEDAEKSICLKNTSDSSKTDVYSKYEYLYDDSISLNGTDYHLLNDNRNGSPIAQISFANPLVPVSTDNAQTNAVSDNDYYANWDAIGTDYLTNLRKVLIAKEIKSSPSMKVYSIDEIDPKEAVYIYFSNSWFTQGLNNEKGIWVLLTKANNYTGKTINDVMKDKGIETDNSSYN